MIYFMRHGQDDENYIGGWSDVELIQSGINDAELVGEWINNNKLVEGTNILAIELHRYEENEVSNTFDASAILILDNMYIYTYRYHLFHYQ